MNAVRLATRRSPLALAQAATVQRRLRDNGVESELVLVETSGDRNREVPLRVLGGLGVFALEVQRALLDGHADVAVHSAKDLPSVTPTSLVLGSVPERRDAADVLVGRALAGLGPGATVATGSPRRRALLLERRPDIQVVDLRGNMSTRLAKAGHDGVDAVITAAAALERLGESDLMVERLDPSWFVPQVGQGSLALEVRAEDESALDVVRRIDDVDAHLSLRCERAFLAELGTGCSIPAGAYATVANGVVTLLAVMVGVDGSHSVRASDSGVDPELLGATMAKRLRDDDGGSTLPGWTTDA